MYEKHSTACREYSHHRCPPGLECYNKHLPGKRQESVFLFSMVLGLLARWRKKRVQKEKNMTIFFKEIVLFKEIDYVAFKKK